MTAGTRARQELPTFRAVSTATTSIIAASNPCKTTTVTGNCEALAAPDKQRAAGRSTPSDASSR